MIFKVHKWSLMIIWMSHIFCKAKFGGTLLHGDHRTPFTSLLGHRDDDRNEDQPHLFHHNFQHLGTRGVISARPRLKCLKFRNLGAVFGCCWYFWRFYSSFCWWYWSMKITQWSKHGSKSQTPGAQFYSFHSSPQKKLCLKFLMSKSWVFEIFVWK